LLFLGDYVDRGKHSTEVMAILLCLKVKFPHNVILLRGNHESREMTIRYGFAAECKSKYGKATYKLFCQMFDKMPICAVADGRAFCVHGGISPALTTLEEIDFMPRIGEVPDSGLICDLLWSDPEPAIEDWGPNDRGASIVTWGLKPALKFLNENGLEMIVRGHQVIEDGHEYPFGIEKAVVTVFSATCSPDDYTNKGCFMTIEENKPPIFTDLPYHPPESHSAQRLGKAKKTPGGYRAKWKKNHSGKARTVFKAAYHHHH
jgi:serine/threonine-protein phosphatase PP1 catalytic subunit